MKSTAVSLTLILMGCCFGCQKQSPQPVTQVQPSDQDEVDADVARQVQDSFFHLGWFEARSAAAAGDEEELQAAKNHLFQTRYVGLAGLVAVVTGNAPAEDKLLAVSWIGELVTEVKHHALQTS